MTAHDRAFVEWIDERLKHEPTYHCPSFRERYLMEQAWLASRKAALTEAAKVCRRGVDMAHPIIKTHVMKQFHQSDGLADAILALIDK